jgi:hypothetical protein
MPDNVAYTPGAGATIAAREVPYSGDTALLQVIGVATVEGPDDAKIAKDVSKDNPMPVQGQRTDDLLGLLQRLVKVCETLQVVDFAQRQRIAIDSISANLNLQGVNVVTTVATVNNVAAQTGMAGMDREMYINIAKQTYAQSIRANLTFQ